MQDEPAYQGDLKGIAVTGMRWTGLAQVARLSLQFLTTLVFAWLLEPADFGLVGMAAVVVGFVTLFKDLGTGAALVQGDEPGPDVLSTVFWANVGIGLLAGGLLYAGGPWLADLYREPRLTGVVRVLALALPLSGPAVVPLSLLQRRLRFATIARVETTAQAAGAVAGVATAVLGAGMWSLVIHALVIAGLQSALALSACGGVAAGVFRPRLLRGVARYGAGLTGFQVTHWLTRNVDQLLLGRVFGATALGYYVLACRLVLIPLQAATSVVARVLFPLYSRIQDDHARLRHAYLRVAPALATVLFPALAGLAVISGPFVDSFFGAKWSAAAPIITLMASAGFLIVVGTSVGVIYQATGRTDLLLRWGILAAVVMIAAYAVGLAWGPLGVAAASLVAMVVLTYPGLAIPLRLIGMRAGSVFAVLVRPALATFGMAAATLLFGWVIQGHVAPAVQLAAMIAFGVVAYAAASLLINRHRTREILVLALRRSPDR
jgi:PST family polysaccharide transporter